MKTKNMKTKNISLVQYDDCKECSYCEFPDKNGEIKIPGGLLFLSKTILTKNGEIPNPIIARCGVSGKRLNELNGCKRWFNGVDIVIIF